MKNKILLIGTGSLMNYGCEAIIQGTYIILKKYIPDCEIYLASDNTEYDKRLLPDDIKLIEYKKRFTLIRIFKGILRRIFHIGKGSPVRMNTNIYKRFNIVLSCGGDNFCEAPDGALYNLLLDLKQIGDNCIRHNKKYIIWGASVGPFLNKENEKFILNSIVKYTGILVRERKSFEYLSNFKLPENKLKLIADPAFCMSPENILFEKEPESIYIGLNFSLLAIGHSVRAQEQDKFISLMYQQFDSVLSLNEKIRFICIPHVLTDIGGPQDDYAFMNLYVNKSKFKDRITILPKYLGARKTKGYIAQCDLLIASRMHCCVAGISIGIPTLFLTYSNKGIGMAKYAYGNDSYDIPYQDIVSDKFIHQVMNMLSNRKVIHGYLLKQHNRFVNDAFASGQYLSEIISAK